MSAHQWWAVVLVLATVTAVFLLAWSAACRWHRVGARVDRLSDPRLLPSEQSPFRDVTNITRARERAAKDAVAWEEDAMHFYGASQTGQPFDLPAALAPVYGPWPVDTGPLIIPSELAATEADLGRKVRGWIAETDWLIEQGEQQIPRRWR